MFPPRAPRPRSPVAALAAAGTVLLGCGSGPPTDGVASAAPSTSTSAAATASGGTAGSASPSASAVVHQPGTVPTALPSASPTATGDAPLPAVPPKLERRAAQPSPRKGPKDLDAASWLDAGHVIVGSPGRLEIVDVNDATSLVLTTGARVRALATAASHVVTLDESDRVVLWDRSEKSAARSWPLPAKSADGDAHVAVSPGGERVAFANSESVKAWDGATGEELFEVKREVPTFQLVVTKDEVVATSNNFSIDAWRLDDGKPTASTSFATGATFGIQVSPDGRWGAGGSPAGHGLEVSEIRQSGSLRRLVDSQDCTHHVGPSFSGDGRYVYAHLGQDWIKGFETGTWKPYASYRAEPGRVIAASSGDLGRVITTNEGHEAAVVVVATKKATPLERPFDASASYAFNDDGSLVVATNDAHELRVWSAKTAKVVLEITPE